MAAKTPVLFADTSPTAPGANGPVRKHPRPNLINQMERRAKGNARRMVRSYQKASKS